MRNKYVVVEMALDNFEPSLTKVYGPYTLQRDAYAAAGHMQGEHNQQHDSSVGHAGKTFEVCSLAPAVGADNG